MQQNYDIQKVKSGDVAAFRQFFEFLYPKLMGLACRFVSDDVAKDLVQEIFVDYWEQKQLIEVVNIQSYLYKSVQNKCLNFIKHQLVADGYATRVKIAQARVEHLSRMMDDNELFKQVSDKDLREVIEASVQKLPPKCQEAFRLCYFYDMTCKKAAGVMGLSPRTVEGHVQKAIALLRKDLQPLMILVLLMKL